MRWSDGLTIDDWIHLAKILEPKKEEKHFKDQKWQHGNPSYLFYIAVFRHLFLAHWFPSRLYCVLLAVLALFHKIDGSLFLVVHDIKKVVRSVLAKGQMK